MTGVLGIDLGGTRFRAGIATAADPVGVTVITDEPAPPNLEAFTARIVELLAAHGAARLGVGIPGLAEGTLCRWVPNLGYLDGHDLADLFPGTTVALGNDAHLALLAEATGGAARGMSDAILLAIGTGIGSAVLSGGRILGGHRGGACSFGWAVADLDDPGDARLGWLERTASGTALDAIARAERLANGPALIAAARRGDLSALRALAGPVRALGTTLAGAVALLDPQVVIFAGGVAAATELIGPMVRERLRAHLPPHLRSIDIRQGTFGPQAGLVGAIIAGRRGTIWENING